MADPARRVEGRLNTFQRTMLQWNDLHPYNAVHVARIPEAPDPDRLQRVINATLAARGLTGLVLDRRAGTYRYEGGQATAALKLLTAPGERIPALAAEIEQQLNAPFACAERFEPFRFFAAPEAGAFWLGLTYFHPAADAESVVWLMKDLAEAYRGRHEATLLTPLERCAGGPERLLLRRPGLLIRAIAGLPSMLRGMRQCCRAPAGDPDERHNGFRWVALSGACLERMTAAARRWGVAFNDLVVAALLHSLSPLAAERRQARRRRRLAIGIIANVRKDLGVESPRTFGLLLGSFQVSHEVPEGIRLKDLAQAVRAQTARVKRSRLYLGTPLQLGFARLLFSRLSERQRLRFYPKNYPLWGGVTNMNLNALWDPRSDAGPSDYFRAVSTGPATPLVVSLTTVRERVTVGLSYRSAVFAESAVDRVQGDLSAALEQPERNA